jgi:hypothetical protein
MTEETQAPKEAGLSLEDIAGGVQIIDIATGRGAIRGQELLAVGSLRERYVAFLRAAKEQGKDIDIPGEEPEVNIEE